MTQVVNENENQSNNGYGQGEVKTRADTEPDDALVLQWPTITPLTRCAAEGRRCIAMISSSTPHFHVCVDLATISIIEKKES